MTSGCQWAIGRICMVFAFALPLAAARAQIAAKPIKPDSPALVLWRARASYIQKTLEETEEESCYGAPAIEIVDAFGVRDDALSVALVDFCTGGAYTDRIVAMRMDHGKPVLAELRDENGKTVENGFSRGASAMHSADVKLEATKRTIYELFANNDSGGKPALCSGKAYVWNARRQTFDLDLQLSKNASTAYCRSLPGQ
jgi:hypothetical protein